MTQQPEDRKAVDQDTLLVEAIQAGHSEKFTQLVERYDKALFRFGYKICGNEDEAEELVQDTFLNVLRYLKDFRHETKFRNWLYRIAVSACQKRHRRSKFAPGRELSLDEFLPNEEQAAALQPPLWASKPLDQVLNEELGRLLNEGIGNLPDKYKIVLVLRDVENFSTKETARILNLSPANIKVRLHRARLFLREQIKDYFDAEELV
jgi:RNA polymerase sigma-70 factor (ECF subfamily)